MARSSTSAARPGRFRPRFGVRSRPRQPLPFSRLHGPPLRRPSPCPLGRRRCHGARQPRSPLPPSSHDWFTTGASVSNGTAKGDVDVPAAGWPARSRYRRVPTWNGGQLLPDGVNPRSLRCWDGTPFNVAYAIDVLRTSPVATIPTSGRRFARAITIRPPRRRLRRTRPLDLAGHEAPRQDVDPLQKPDGSHEHQDDATHVERDVHRSLPGDSIRPSARPAPK